VVLAERLRLTGWQESALAWGLVVVFTLAVLAFFSWTGLSHRTQELPGVSNYSLFEWLVLLLPSVLTWYLALRTRTILIRPPGSGRWGLPEVARPRALWRIAALGLAGAFVAAFAVGVTRGEPPLPAVQITASTSVEGKLLAHLDRFWYVFVFDEHGTLVAVTDEEVTEVRISS
jgi:hypothetical protein